jgi:hypothetical protein
MLPKKGKTFPGGNGQGDVNGNYAMLIAVALREQLGTSHQAVKTAMRWTGAGERTVKNWFAATNGPSGEHLVALARHSDAILSVFLAMSGRPDAMIGAKLADIRDRLAEMLVFIDELIGRPSQ